MTLPADAPGIITRAQWAAFVTDASDTPIQQTIQDLESQQDFITADIPTELAALEVAVTAAAGAATAASIAAAAANAAAAAAQTTADAAAVKLAGDTFLTTAAEASLPTSRHIVISGPGLQAVDGGAGGAYTFSLTDQNVILANDTADATAAFVNAVGLLGVLAPNSTYLVEAALTFQSAAITTGLALTFTLPAGATITGAYDHPLTLNTFTGSYNNAAGAVGANTTDVPAAATNLPIRGRWIIKTAGTAGNAQLQLRTEVAASAITLKKDLSVLRFLKIG